MELASPREMRCELTQGDQAEEKNMNGSNMRVRKHEGPFQTTAARQHT